MPNLVHKMQEGTIFFIFLINSNFDWEAKKMVKSVLLSPTFEIHSLHLFYVWPDGDRVHVRRGQCFIHFPLVWDCIFFHSYQSKCFWVLKNSECNTTEEDSMYVPILSLSTLLYVYSSSSEMFQNKKKVALSDPKHLQSTCYVSSSSELVLENQ